MLFKARLVAPNRTPPARIYWHSAGANEVFLNDADKARIYVREILDEQRESLSHFDYLLGAVWGALWSDAKVPAEDKVLDLFGYNDTRVWPGNPDVHSYVFRNGEPSLRNPITCGDTMIVLGLEEEYRRNTHNLKEYMRTPPRLTRATLGLETLEL